MLMMPCRAAMLQALRFRRAGRTVAAHASIVPRDDVAELI